MLDAFWWSPLRMPHTFKEEVLRRPGMWLRQSARTRRPLTNFGDELSKYVMQYAFETKVRWVKPRLAEIVGIGSIIDFYLQAGGTGASVWGSGVRDPQWFSRNSELLINLGPILAVRGPGTQSIVAKSQNIALGDPGLLCNVLLSDGRRKQGTQGSPIFLPHFQSWDTSDGRKSIAATRRAGYEILSPTTHPRIVAQKIDSASLLITSSLHGVIVAHAVGTPVAAICNSANSQELNFKYDDYFRTVGACYQPQILQDCQNPKDVLNRIESQTVSVEDLQCRAFGRAQSLVDAARSA